jgi:hypothetical protein
MYTETCAEPGVTIAAASSPPYIQCNLILVSFLNVLMSNIGAVTRFSGSIRSTRIGVQDHFLHPRMAMLLWDAGRANSNNFNTVCASGTASVAATRRHNPSQGASPGTPLRARRKGDSPTDRSRDLPMLRLIAALATSEKETSPRFLQQAAQLQTAKRPLDESQKTCR